MGKRKKGNAQWIKETLELQDDHRWQSNPGYKIFVADRGAVRFDVPANWHFEPDTKSFKFIDKKPPHDMCGDPDLKRLHHRCLNRCNLTLRRSLLNQRTREEWH